MNRFIVLLIVMFCVPAVYSADPEILSPAPGQITDATRFGEGAIITLRWTSPPEAKIQDWAIYVGSEPGKWDYQRITHMNRYLFVGLDIPEEESLRIGIPADGSTFYVRFFWAPENEDFSYIDLEYIAPEFSAPRRSRPVRRP